MSYRPYGSAPPPPFGGGGQSMQLPQTNYPTMSWAQRAFPTASPFGYPASQSGHQYWGHGVYGSAHPHAQLPPQPSVHEIGHAARGKPEPHIFTCEPCEKEFPSESQYIAHTKQHIKCHDPECEFEASRKVVMAHHVEEHGGLPGRNNKGSKDDKWLARPALPSLDSPEEIERWRAERRKNWPSETVVAQKEQERRKRPADSKGPKAKKQRSDGQLAAEGTANAMGLIATYASDSEQEHLEAEASQEEQDGAAPRSGSGQEPKSSNTQNPRVCKYWLQRKCKNGKRCRFLHESKKADRQHVGEGKKDDSLLKKLLAKDIRNEHMVILQCIRYIVSTGFLQQSPGP